jgi:isopenicillin N synthase-like dioxygenase
MDISQRPVVENAARAPPIIDFAGRYTTPPRRNALTLAAFRSDDTNDRRTLVQQVKSACLAKGFFQLINHGISTELQEAIFAQSEQLFALPEETKMKYSQAEHPNKLGYERLRSQNFEKKTAGDLKEGFFIGRTLAEDHPYVLQKRIHCGKNAYPTELPQTFEETVTTYHRQMTALAEDVLSVIAETLSLPPTYFKNFSNDAVAVLRLLHYPPQAVDADPNERGIGAHTDFGTLTLLLQDDVGGLQVFDEQTETWIDVAPTPGALVVNLGNVMMRWSNDRYKSNLHRVINKSGKTRYSIPFFYSGNPDFVIDCLPGCEDVVVNPEKQIMERGCKYAPVRVQDWIMGRHANTFSEAKGVEELSKLAKVAA